MCKFFWYERLKDINYSDFMSLPCSYLKICKINISVFQNLWLAWRFHLNWIVCLLFFNAGRSVNVALCIVFKCVMPYLVCLGCHTNHFTNLWGHLNVLVWYILYSTTPQFNFFFLYPDKLPSLISSLWYSNNPFTSSFHTFITSLSQLLHWW